MFYISEEETWLPLYAVIFYALFKKFGFKGLWIAVLFVVLCVVATDQGSVQLFKNMIQRYRPCHNLEIKELVHLVNNHCGGQYGFISSHASNTAGVAFLLIPLLKNKIWTIALLTWVFLNVYSRVYLGVHYPSDVLAGYMFGYLIGGGMYLLLIRGTRSLGITTFLTIKD